MSFGKNCKFMRKGFEESATSFEEDMQEIKLLNVSPNPDPEYAKQGDSGFDLRAWINEEYDNAKQDKDKNWYIEMKPMDRILVHTGIYVNLPKYTELQIRSRSGMTLKYGVIVGNTPGTVDCYYTGEVGVILINLSKKNVIIHNGDKVAQAVLAPVYNSELVNIVKVDEVEDNDIRGDKGFGSTGYK